MLEKIINYSLKHKFIIILITLTIAGFGIYSIANMSIGAVPDITNNQVQVITTSGNLSTQEIEQFITAPVELEMANLPGVIEIRSVSKFGLSVVTIVFEDKVGTYIPRQLIAEKIKTAASNIPEGFGTPEMGPITTGLGEIYQYILDVESGYENKYSAMELRSIQDWIVKRQLSGIPGVVEINSWGGYLKQYEVAVDPLKLKRFDLSLTEIFDALETNNSISGGAYIEKTNQSYFIRGDGQVKSLEDIGNIVISNKAGTPILIKNVAKVRFGHANRYGAITANGQGEKVLGQIMMLKDANSKLVINEVQKRVQEIQKNLPEGVFINPILERSELISKTSFTVIENLIIGCLIVVLIVILLLGNIRSALVIASMIPLSLLFTLSMMYLFDIDANLMSLGALDFGIIIDGAVIIVEFIAISLTAKKRELESSGQKLIDTITFTGASKMMKSAIFGQVIILIVLIPVLALSGVEGKMFRPMALSFSFAIIGAMILGFTWLPVASALFLKPAKNNRKSISDRIMSFLYLTYRPIMNWACSHKRIVLSAAIISLVLTGYTFSKMGGEFVPTLDEGDFVIQPVLKTGTSLSKTIEMTTKMENILLDKFSEVDQIVCRIGAAEVPTDPMSMEEIDMIIKLKPKDKWENAENKEELADKFKEALSIIPGIEYEFTQPIEMRFNELITGVRADIAVKIFGEDLNYLNKKAIEVKKIIEGIPGAADVILEKTAGLPQMNISYDRNKIAYYGVNIKTLNSYVAMAFGGERTGSVFEGEKRFDLVVRLQEENRVDLNNIKQLQVPLPNGKQIPLSELANITYSQGPAKISRENTHRRVVVSVNVRNRDLQSVVKDIQAKIEDHITLLPGNYITYGGQFENLQNASKRLLFAVPLALALIFIFLHFAFRSFKDAIMIFTAVPLSAVGGVFFLWIRGMPFSVSAGIGFIALFGIAVLNGIVLIEHLKYLQNQGVENIRKLILQGTKDRLRPVLLTAGAAAMGFLPMAISTGAGAEVQRPLATVVIGGLITSTMLTMIALPLLFEIFYNVKGIKFRPFRFVRAKPCIIIFLFLSSSVASFAQEHEVTRDEAINIALKNNKEISAYTLRVKKSEAIKKTAFDVNKALLYYNFDENNLASNNYPLHIYGIEQSFSFPTVYTAQDLLNKQNKQLAEADLKQASQMLIRNVSDKYFDIQYLLNKKHLLLQLDSLYLNFNKNAEIKYNQGDISNLELLNSKAKQQQVRKRLNQIKHDLENAFQSLKALMQFDSLFIINRQEIKLAAVENKDIYSNIGLKIMELRTDYNKAAFNLEQQKILPDISLGYFIGNNKYSGSNNYNGFEIGLAIPLFFGAQKAKIKAEKINIDISEHLTENYLVNLKSTHIMLQNELLKYMEQISYYNQNGKQLSEEIIRTSQKNYELGDIDFFQYVMSIENAINIKLDYIDAVTQYNKVVMRINYFNY